MSTVSQLTLGEQAVRRGAVQKPGELSLLLPLLPDPLETVLEIGTCLGGTLWLWCQVASNNALILSVDLPGGTGGGGYTKRDAERFQRDFPRHEQKLICVRADSHLPETRAHIQDLLGGRAVDFLFVDGDHSYEGVKKDWLMYSPLVRKGGVVAFHDIVAHPPNLKETVGVDRLWAEIGGQGDELTDPAGGQWGGIGLLRL